MLIGLLFMEQWMKTTGNPHYRHAPAGTTTPWWKY
jgi:hypothetical protein